MGSVCIIRKVPFKTSNRIVWGLILSEREGVALMILQRMDETKAHSLVVACEGANGIFEAVEISRFPFYHGDLEKVGSKLQALGSEFDEESFYKFLRPGNDDWWRGL